MHVHTHTHIISKATIENTNQEKQNCISYLTLRVILTIIGRILETEQKTGNNMKSDYFKMKYLKRSFKHMKRSLTSLPHKNKYDFHLTGL